MIKVLEKNNKKDLLYTCNTDDTLESVAQKFNITVSDILRDNPLFSSVYPGCMLYLTGLGRRKVIVAPLQNLDDIARENNVSVESIIKANNLHSKNVFVGMQLYIEE